MNESLRESFELVMGIGIGLLIYLGALLVGSWIELKLKLRQIKGKHR